MRWGREGRAARAARRARRRALRRIVRADQEPADDPPECVAPDDEDERARDMLFFG